MQKKQITAENIKDLLHYEPESGAFTWKVNVGRFGRIPAGSLAGSVNKCHGYTAISYGGHLYPAHRVAWLYMTGEWPKDEIDHINRQRSDNRWENLRSVTRADNLLNKCLYKSNKSGFAGVGWHKRIGKWQAVLRVKNTRMHLGYWDDLIAAASAVAEKRREVVGA